jgi:Ca-activated chloride channel homolog
MNVRLKLATAVALFSICVFIISRPQSVSAGQPAASTSQLGIIGKDGKVTGFVPLKHTAIKTEISGFVARTEVTQEFENILPDAVEAIYVFPLPHDSAVDGMTMKVGEREVRAVIKEREEARKIYEQARNAGHTAALLDQERPNIFTQSVTNIPPNGKVQITISVIEMLKYEAGTYEFAFPLVVGPRYIPGAPAAPAEQGTMANTNQVPDASRISPPVAGVHTDDPHAGHDVSLEVTLAAGVPVAEVTSSSHKIFADRTGPDSFHVQLSDTNVLPDKDFILRYQVAGSGVSDAVLTHSDKSGGYFTLILQPPDKPRDEAVVPRQLIFVLDTSGSMWGFPLEMAKKTIARALDNLRKDETFNLITFSGDTRILFPEPVPATEENVAKAKKVLAGAYGSGGTEMMKAIRTALGDDAGAGKPMEADPVRVVCFMTDGYVGNDADIIAEVKKHSDARVFAFGIGTAVNRFLLSKMSKEGHGEVEFVTNPKEAEAAADRFYERVHSPVLIDISIDWNGLPVTDVYPKNVRDLFSAKPIIITGRFTGTAKGNIVIKGTQANGPFSRTVPVNFSLSVADKGAADNAALEKIWARNKVEDLMSQDWEGIQQGNSKKKAEIIKVGLEHSLATQYTSFVAVEERTVVQDGKPVRIEVPVELPQGVSPLAVPGGGGNNDGLDRLALAPPSPGIGLFRCCGNASTTVEVTSTAPMIETSTAQVTTVFSGEALGNMPDSPTGSSKSKEDRETKRKLAEAKLSPNLLALYQCAFHRRTSATINSCKAADAPITVEVELTATTPQIAQKLAHAGLQTISGAGTTTVTGSLRAFQLRALAEIAEVKSVTQPDGK